MLTSVMGNCENKLLLWLLAPKVGPLRFPYDSPKIPLRFP